MEHIGSIQISKQKLAVWVIRSVRRRRSYSMRLDESGRVVFRASGRVSGAELLRFAASKERWLSKRLGDLQTRIKKNADINQMDGKVCVLPAAWWAAAAERQLPAMTARYAAEMGLFPRRVLIGHARSQWGCCMPNRDIRYSYRLMQVSEKLREYVVVHELAHLKHMNHGKRFWALVAAHMPDYAERRKALRKEGVMLL